MVRLKIGNQLRRTCGNVGGFSGLTEEERRSSLRRPIRPHHGWFEREREAHRIRSQNRTVKVVSDEQPVAPGLQARSQVILVGRCEVLCCAETRISPYVMWTLAYGFRPYLLSLKIRRCCRMEYCLCANLYRFVEMYRVIYRWSSN